MYSANLSPLPLYHVKVCAGIYVIVAVAVAVAVAVTVAVAVSVEIGIKVKDSVTEGVAVSAGKVEVITGVLIIGSVIFLFPEHDNTKTMIVTDKNI